jgi:hypothetical protein
MGWFVWLCSHRDIPMLWPNTHDVYLNKLR